jgi:periplasmic protein TonB
VQTLIKPVEPVVAASPPAAPNAAVVVEVEPDYKASYLNNRLIYPLAARRMGIQGRVVLEVEVLAEGVSGQINVAQSSGHAVLDKAALESVKTWCFIPARRAGQSYTKWFKVPVQFLLKDNVS